MQYASPYVRVAMDSVLLPPWVLSERMIWDYELLYLKEGQLLVTVEDRSCQVVPGDLFLFKPRQRHSIRLIGDRPVRQPHVHFDLFHQENSEEVKVSFKPVQEMDDREREWFREDCLSGQMIDLPNHIRLRNPHLAEEKLFDLIQEFERKSPLYEWTVKARLLELLTLLVRELDWNSRDEVGAHRDRLVDIQEYINGHVHRNITLDELSDRFHLSKYYLIHLFKRAFQLSPIQYHQKVRLERAKNFIRYTNLSLKEIADQLGYDNIHAFSRAFKSKEGVPPSYYRTI